MTPEDLLQHLVAKLDQRYTVAKARTQRTEAELAAKQLQLQALKDEVRQARAIDLLLRTSQPVARVARAAGFQNDKSFIRAFRQWTGLTPEQYRQARGDGQHP